MNGYLLDTHALLWWLDSPERLSNAAKQVIGDSATRVCISSIAGWEIGVKSAIGKLQTPDPKTLMQAIDDAGIHILEPTFKQGLALQALPLHHGDPFDRLMVAQAQAEQLVLISSDKWVQRYNVPVLRA